MHATSEVTARSAGAAAFAAGPVPQRSLRSVRVRHIETPRQIVLEWRCSVDVSRLDPVGMRRAVSRPESIRTEIIDE